MIKTAKRLIAAGGIFYLLFFFGCGTPAKKELDTPTRGRIKAAIDDSYRLLAEAEVYAFESLYKDAHIDTVFKPELQVIEDFLNDSVPLILVSRKLTDAQEKYLNSLQYVPKTTKIAYDAVAFIVNNDNPDTLIFYDKIKEIFCGKIDRWQQINPKSKLKELLVVFDDYRSANPRYFKEKFKIDSLPKCCAAVSSNAEVVNFVATHKNAMGVVSVNWISDNQDSVSNNFLKKIKVVGITTEGNSDADAKFYKPYQAYIAENTYPFTREVYCINRQPYHGLAYGFSSFIAGEKGQLIILRSGLVPAAMPVRIVEVKK
jgi:phosphate transport system substrate-binding protein